MNRRTLLALIGGAAVAPSVSVASPDSAVLDRLLARHVSPSSDGLNRVNYAAWRASAADRAALAGYIRALERTDPAALSRADQMAFWINLYNAETLRVVLDAYPVGSILLIRPTLVSVGPWKAKTLRVAGEAVSLDHIEHGILRPRYRDPRIHYAINCASVGCPNLLTRAWRGETLSQDLDAAARAYINSPRGVRVTPQGLRISSIYKWFREDFGGDEAGVRAHLARFAGPELAAALARSPKIVGYAYDWSLNGVRR